MAGAHAKSLFSLARIGIQGKLTLLFYITALLSVTIVGLYAYNHARNAYLSKAIDLADANTIRTANRLAAFIQSTRDDVEFISKFYAMQRYLYWEDIGDKNQMKHWQDIAISTIRDFMEVRQYHYKISLRDHFGVRQFALRHDFISNNIELISKQNNIVDPQYANLSSTLKPGEIQITGPLFSMEHGHVERPLVSILRFVAPLSGIQDVHYGTVSINVFTKSLLAPILDANNNGYSQLFYLIDFEGRYLFRPDEDVTFQQILGKNLNLEKEQARLLTLIHGQTNGFSRSGGHIYTFRMIQQDSDHQGHPWYLIGTVDESKALAELNTFITAFSIIFILVFLGVLLSVRYIVKEFMRPVSFVTRQLQRLGRGEAIPETLAYFANDEIRKILDSTKQVVANMQRLTRQVDAVAGGDFKSQIVPLSEQDRLGIAINNMTKRLASAQITNEQRNWLKDELSNLSHAITGDLTSTELANRAISQIGRSLNVGRGVFYVLDGDAKFLELLGSYMFTERSVLGTRVNLGEGAIGQVARERKPIILDIGIGQGRNVDPIITGTVSTLPRYTYTWPMLWEDDLHGVIEIAVINRLSETELEYLAEATNTSAYFLYAVLQRERIKELLDGTEEAARRVREQNIKLQEANTMMEEQQQQLQQQTAELQQINAQMEEQQQQLQQQSEELRQTNNQMERQQQNLEIQANELGLRNRELEQVSRYKSEFLANMSHELRTPLNSILLLSKMLAVNEGEHLDAEEIKRASVIHAAGSDLLNLINDILDLSKIEAGKMELNPQLVSSDILITDFRRQFEDTAKAKNLDFLLTDDWKDNFTTDRDKLNQIIRNFLSNAFKFTQIGQVSLNIRPSDEPNFSVCIAVTDSGIGIPVDKQQIIFNAFQQVDGSISRRFGGTGLGLSISLRLAQLLGGVIRVSSTQDVGSEFRLLLPKNINMHSIQANTHTQLALVEHEQAVQAVQAVQTSNYTFMDQQSITNTFDSPKTNSSNRDWPQDDRESIKPGDSVILVIDDDPNFSAAIAKINRNNGHKTLLAACGNDGLKLAHAYHPTGILLDLGLPDIDGMEVLKKLKVNRELHNIPVYVISGREQPPEILRQGIVGYLQKPLSDSQILAVEAQVIKQATVPRYVLIMEDDELELTMIEHLLPDGSIALKSIKTVEEARQICITNLCSLILLGLNPHTNFQICLERCQKIHELIPGLPIMLYAQEGVSGTQEAALRPYTDSIVVQTSHADQRILENIERFAREVRNIDQQPTVSAAQGSKNRLRNRRILVVDDDGRNLFVVTSALEQQGAQVSNAIDGIQALEILRKEPVDLVFMDIMMPKMNGYKAIEIIKADPMLKTIPIVALTAKAFKEDHKQAIDAGADDYLAKPVDYQILVNMAAVWCERIKN